MVVDLVYPVRPGENEELRYSLRSVAENADGLFRKVWVVGSGLPDWLTNVNIIETVPVPGPAQDVRHKISTATNDPRVATRMVILDDDYFLVDPITEWAAFHMGPTSEYMIHVGKYRPPLTLQNSSWLQAVTATTKWMAEQGYPDPLARQGHRPLLWHKRKLAEALAEYPADQPLDIVGLYDIAGGAGVGERAGNTKIRDAAKFHQKLVTRDSPWMSSIDESFSGGMIGGYIRGMFRTRSRFEA